MYRSRQHETPATESVMREDKRAALREKAREINDKADQEASKEQASQEASRELAMMYLRNEVDTAASNKGVLGVSQSSREGNDTVRAYGDSVYASENRQDKSRGKTGVYVYVHVYVYLCMHMYVYVHHAKVME